MRRVEHWSEHDASCGTSCTKPHLACPFPAGTQKAYLDAFAESDWAAKKTERKSSSCVVIRLGKSGLEASVTSLSNGEAELYVATRAAACVKKSVGHLPLRVHSDSAAARGMMTRRGSGWVKHLDIRAVWFQEANDQGRFRQT